MKMVADRHRFTTYYDKYCQQLFQKYWHRWP